MADPVILIVDDELQVRNAVDQDSQQPQQLERGGELVCQKREKAVS